MIAHICGVWHGVWKALAVLEGRAQKGLGSYLAEGGCVSLVVDEALEEDTA